MRTTLVEEYIFDDKGNKFKSMCIHILIADFEQVVPPWEGNFPRKQDNKKTSTDDLVTKKDEFVSFAIPKNLYKSCAPF